MTYGGRWITQVSTTLSWTSTTAGANSTNQRRSVYPIFPNRTWASSVWPMYCIVQYITLTPARIASPWVTGYGVRHQSCSTGASFCIFVMYSSFFTDLWAFRSSLSFLQREAYPVTSLPPLPVCLSSAPPGHLRYHQPIALRRREALPAAIQPCPAPSTLPIVSFSLDKAGQMQSTSPETNGLDSNALPLGLVTERQQHCIWRQPDNPIKPSP